jgi:cyclohexanone monooxygenase
MTRTKQDYDDIPGTLFDAERSRQGGEGNAQDSSRPRAAIASGGTLEETRMSRNGNGKGGTETYDGIVVGAGFAGLYALHRLRSEGYCVRALEAADAVGGTWYWNRYPGARCDVESMQYSYSFADDIQEEWTWSELYAPQPEILRYINFVADKLDLRKDIQLNTRVSAAKFDDDAKRWEITTQAGEKFVTRFCVMATGCLSIPLDPALKGLEDFRGNVYRTSNWPHEGVDFTGKRVGLIGTGSSGIQATPRLAEQAKHLAVFQRTPNYSIPACNRPLEPEYVQDWKENYRERRRAARKTKNNTLNNAGQITGASVTWEERQREFEARWKVGGIGFMYAYTDMTSSQEVNHHAAEFVRRKIAETVSDPATADKLMPKNYPIGAKRICVDTDYFATFNRGNVVLVDIKADPIETVTATGIRTGSQEYPLDVIVLATGFDAITGALQRIEITGKGGKKLRDKWAEGPKTYLGMMVAGFPNFFLITGPGSPSVFTNMVISVEQHADWIAECINYMKYRQQSVIDAHVRAEEAWVARVNEVAGATLMSKGNSWYVGANVPGKPRVFMPFLGGADNYLKICEDVAQHGYEGFELA